MTNAIKTVNLEKLTLKDIHKLMHVCKQSWKTMTDSERNWNQNFMSKLISADLNWDLPNRNLALH